MATPLGQQRPLQFDFSDPQKLAQLAMQFDPQIGQLLLTAPPAQFDAQPPQQGYMDMLSPRNESGVNLSPAYQAQLQQGFNSGAQAQAEAAVPVEAFGGTNPIYDPGPGTGAPGVDWMALLNIANAAAQGQRKQQPQIGQAYAIAPQNQWKGFQAQPLQAPATRQRAGSLAQIIGMR